uniref:Uncharacterized protein n=1 Tax=Anguilla anguilla TaxID=7936 RepID=A0A0E9W205_ANGAN
MCSSVVFQHYPTPGTQASLIFCINLEREVGS